MILESSGPPGGPLGGLLGRLGGLRGASWAVLGRLGLSWAVLEAVLDHLGRTWRPSWTILEAILGQRGHLGGHLEPSWRIFWELGDVLGVLRVVGGREIGELRSWAILSGGRRDVPEPQGESFWKKNQNQNREGSARQAPL